MMSLSDSENQYFTPVRGLNEYVYCPRLFHLMYVQGLFDESVDTVEGAIAHNKRLGKTKAVSKMEDNEENYAPWRSDIVREFSLSSDQFGIYGKFDVIMANSNEIVPVEVKHGPAPDGSAPFFVGPYALSASAWGNDQIQLAAQIALLKEAGYQCDKGRLYYKKTSTLVEIQWDNKLGSALRLVAEKTKSLLSAPIPPPLSDSKKCIRCSLNHVCLPDETLHLQGHLDEPRQLYPGRDDCGILHLITPGMKMGKSGEAVKISSPIEKDVSIPMKDISHVCCWGHSQISTQLMISLAERGIGITWLTGGGWLRATTCAPLEKNVLLRREQYKICDNMEICRRLTRWIVESKIENQRVIVRRNGKDEESKDTLKAFKDCKKQARIAPDRETIRGIEGYAAKVYWYTFQRLLKKNECDEFKMNGRNRRPPKDPVNALLSYGYAMLLRDFMTALHGVGLDPLYGFYHSIVPGRPALALDLMEAFRPLVVDSAALRAINEGSFTKDDFVIAKGFCALKPYAKKRWIAAYERRVDELVTHPVFGYRLSYRRIFTLEARLFGRFITGEMPEYHPLITR